MVISISVAGGEKHNQAKRQQKKNQHQKGNIHVSSARRMRLFSLRVLFLHHPSFPLSR